MTTERPPLAALVDNPARFLDDDDAAVRRLAVSALAGRLEGETIDLVLGLLEDDPDETVRAEAAEVLGTIPSALDAVLAARSDTPRVVEAVVTALGSLRHAAAVPWLEEQAKESADPLVREAAVAALGEIGDERAVPTLLELSATGTPQIRRRAVVALTVFEGDEVEAAIRRAAADRNPMVREAAEMVVGRPDEWQHIEMRVDPGG